MKAPAPVAAPSSASSAVAAAASTAAPMPWLPLSSPGPSPPPASLTGAEQWAAALQRVPYLCALRQGPTCVVYRPPTVIQLSEATGCSVGDLTGAYSDLPVITLNKVLPGIDHETTAAAAAISLTSDGVEYLQLSPTDDVLEMAAKALMARRPVPDAEEIFWEADYWEVLRRAKRQAQEEKERRRERKRLQKEKKSLMGVSNSSVGMPSPNGGAAATLSAINSPLYATPHSRQGSLCGPLGDGGDRSPASLHMQTAAQRTAKGLLRRARYNEAHNPGQRLLVRSASLLSQNSQTQSTIRCRTRPRHDSITSQSTVGGARGFQYPLSSVASDDGRSATSDSFRTPPLLVIGGHPSRDPLSVQLELELSASSGAVHPVAATRAAPASAEAARAAKVSSAAAPDVSTPPRAGGGSPTGQRDATRKRLPGSGSAAAATLSSISPASPSSTSPFRLHGDVQRGMVNSLIPSHTTSPNSWAAQPDSVTHAPLVTPTFSPLPGPSGLQRTPPSPPPAGSVVANGHGSSSSSSSRPPPPPPLPPASASAARQPVEKLPPVPAERARVRGGGGEAVPHQPRLLQLPAPHRRPGARAAATAAGSVDTTDALPQPSSQCSTARPPSVVVAAAGGSAAAAPRSAAAGKRRTSPPPPPSSVGAGGEPAAGAVPTAAPPSVASTVEATADGGASNPRRPPPSLSAGTPSPPGGKGAEVGTEPAAEEPRRAAAPPRLPPLLSPSAAPAPRAPAPSTAPARPPMPTSAAAAQPAPPPPPIAAVMTGAAPSPSSSLTPRGAATTVPPSRAPTREVSMSPQFERTAVPVHAAPPITAEDGGNARSSTASPVNVTAPTTATPRQSSAGPIGGGSAPPPATSARGGTADGREEGRPGPPTDTRAAAGGAAAASDKKTTVAAARDTAPLASAANPAREVDPNTFQEGASRRGSGAAVAAAPAPPAKKAKKDKAPSCCVIM
ncbi:hypothetical protein NESM_000266800 [Novymonas esmeraldas]|uniref:Uncharacterized protein n=1 Tax=Novymonas esmeraldas TaxID=1808958 RepID=A0AAW0F6S8_9TRYP